MQENEEIIELAKAYSAKVKSTNKLWIGCATLSLLIWSAIGVSGSEKLSTIFGDFPAATLVVVLGFALSFTFWAFSVAAINLMNTGEMFMRIVSRRNSAIASSLGYSSFDYYMAWVDSSYNRVAPLLLGTDEEQYREMFGFFKLAVDAVYYGVPATALLMVTYSQISSQSVLGVICAIVCGLFSLLWLRLFKASRDWAAKASVHFSSNAERA